jgi:hypothetical protein
MASLANLEQRAKYVENYCLYHAGTYTVKGEPPPKSGAEPQSSELNFFSGGKKKMGLCGGAIKTSVDLMLVPLRRLVLPSLSTASKSPVATAIWRACFTRSSSAMV